MPLETAPNGIQELNPAWPTGTDPKSQGDDHLRLTKGAVQTSFPNMTAPWTTGSKIQCEGIDVQGKTVSAVGTPVAATDAARKGETDALQGLIDTNRQDIVALDGAVVVNQNNIANHETRITGLESQTFVNSYGTVGALGGIGGGGSGVWAVVRTGTGKYRVTFAQAATTLDGNCMVVTCLDGSNSDSGADVNNLSTTVVEVNCYRGGVATDVGFNFIRLRS